MSHCAVATLATATTTTTTVYRLREHCNCTDPFITASNTARQAANLPLSNMKVADSNATGKATGKTVTQEEVDAISYASIMTELSAWAQDPQRILFSFLRLCLVTFLLYCFLFFLDLMGTSFKVLGSCAGGELFSALSNPIAGLMVGVLATVFVLRPVVLDFDLDRRLSRRRRVDERDHRHSGDHGCQHRHLGDEHDHLDVLRR
mmetsp:Transcript_20143/g.42428  ORF Transcript_20143/g.42428 Transcript_20143/m.42428 type:complete len:204 (-) Transcript_20143:597-1208(-)